MTVSKEAQTIRGMFAAIAPRYDLLNHLLSLNIDRRWRRRTARALDLSPGDRVIDACTGTADLALELARWTRPAAGGLVCATDFCPEMVKLGDRKRSRRGADGVRLLVADTQNLPFADGSFDAATVAFGIRNLESLDAGLRELARVLKPGGKLAVLEFSTPAGRWRRRLFALYFHRLLPRVGAIVSGGRAGRDAYRYLPASVAEFLSPQELGERMRASGFRDVSWQLLSGGIAALHLAVRSPPPSPKDPPRRHAGP